ncbi:hypothetical protein BFR57_03620 [Idiomarina sp. MD25a]|nr:hypothetical protein BFR57_03620 [Idiomarina sp. MD25a]
MKKHFYVALFALLLGTLSSASTHLSIDSAWHPFIADFATKMTGKVQLTVPTDWELFSPGQQRRLASDSR